MQAMQVYIYMHMYMSCSSVSALMSYSLNSLKGGYIGDYIGSMLVGSKENTRSLDQLISS